MNHEHLDGRFRREDHSQAVWDRPARIRSRRSLAVSPAIAVAQDSKQATSVATTPSAAGQTTYFFKNSAFEFVLLSTLGRAYYQGGNVGKVL